MLIGKKEVPKLRLPGEPGIPRSASAANSKISQIAKYFKDGGDKTQAVRMAKDALPPAGAKPGVRRNKAKLYHNAQSSLDYSHLKRVITLPELEQSTLMNTQTPQSMGTKSI